MAFFPELRQGVLEKFSALAQGVLQIIQVYNIVTSTRTLKALLEADRLVTDLKTKGDVHIQNCHRFFGKWVEKTDPLRDAVKAVVFG